MHTEFSLDWKAFSIFCRAPQLGSQEHGSSMADAVRILTASPGRVPGWLLIASPVPQPLSLLWSLEQVEGLWKDHALGLFLPNCTRLMRPAEESLLETGQHEPCRASHLEPRGACLSHLHLFPTPSYGAGSVILLCKELEQGLWKRNKGERRFEIEV